MLYRFIFIIIVAFSVETAYSQSDTLNRTNESGLKFGYWIFNYENSKKKEEGSFANDQKEGLWKAYYENGNKKSEIIYKNNRPNGYAKFYYEDGTISEEGIWKINKWVGEYKMYHKNGKLSYDWNYSDNGKRTGEQKYYHQNGKIMIQGKWNEGKEDGVVKQYDETGVLVSERSFVDGKQDPSSIKYYDNNNKTNTTVKEEPKTNQESDDKKDWPEGYNRVWLNKVLQAEGFYDGKRLKDGKKYYYTQAGKLEKTVIYKDFKISDIKYE